MSALLSFVPDVTFIDAALAKLPFAEYFTAYNLSLALVLIALSFAVVLYYCRKIGVFGLKSIRDDNEKFVGFDAPLRLVQSQSMLDLKDMDVDDDLLSKRGFGKSGRRNHLEENRSSKRLFGRQGSGVVDGLVNNFLKSRLKSEMRRPRWLSLKEGVKKGVESAVTRYQERRSFQRITKKGRRGDGLASIYKAPALTPTKAQGGSAESGAVANYPLRYQPSTADFLEQHSDEMEVQPSLTILKILQLHPSFSWMPHQILDSLASFAEVQHFVNGQVLYRAGNSVDYVFIVIRGQFCGHLPSFIDQEPSSTHGSRERDFMINQGEGASCVSELLTLLVKPHFTAVVTLSALSDAVGCTVVKISKRTIDNLCSAFPGLLQEWCHRNLIRLNRVLFFAMFSLTRYAVLSPPDLERFIEAESLSALDVDDELSKIQESPFPSVPAVDLPQLLQLLSKGLGVEESKLGSEVSFTNGNNKHIASAPGGPIRGRRSVSFLDASDRSIYKTKEKASVHLFTMPPGSDVIRTVRDPALFLVLKGSIAVCAGEGNTSETKLHGNVAIRRRTVDRVKLEYKVGPGQSFGHFSLLTTSFHTHYKKRSQLTNSSKAKFCLLGGDDYVSTSNLVVLAVTEENYTILLEKFPEILTNKSRGVVGSVLTPPVRQIDNSLLWLSCHVNNVVLKGGTLDNDVFVVLHGRLSSNRIVPSKQRTSIYPDTRSAEGSRSTLHQLVFGSIADAFRKKDSRVPDMNPEKGTGENSSQTKELKLKCIKKSSTKELSIMTLSRGDKFGEIGLITNRRTYPLMVRAVRYSQLVRIPNKVFKKVFFKYPQAILQLGSGLGDDIERITSQPLTESNQQDKRSPKVISVIPSSVQVNVDLFLHIMIEVFKSMDVRIQVLNSSVISQILQTTNISLLPQAESMTSIPLGVEPPSGKLTNMFSNSESFLGMDLGSDSSSVPAAQADCHCPKGLSTFLTRENEELIYSIINEVEDVNDLVFLVADSRLCSVHRNEPSWWSQLCIKQSDLVFHVANGQDDPSLTQLEFALTNQKLKCAVTRELVLLHFPVTTAEAKKEADVNFKMDEFKEPTNTKSWIQNREDISQHHHVRVHLNTGAGSSSANLTGATGMESQKEAGLGLSYANSYNINYFKSDFRRLGRWILNQSVALVLGGGGARGIVHLSVIRVLEERGIPIDFVAGTSIGAFMGGLYAWKTDHLQMYMPVHHFSLEMSSIARKLLDLTFPLIAYFSGHAFNKGCFRIFQDRKIEDLWLPYFCITTDLTDSCQIVHRNGSLWRYARASMTLVNFMPPICDLEDDPVDPGKKKVHYLADGGYVNNLPVDVMRSLTGKDNIVIAVDVQSDWSIEGDDYGDSFYGFVHLFKMLNPFIKTPSVPTNIEIQTQLAFIASVHQGGVGKLEEEMEEDASIMLDNHRDVPSETETQSPVQPERRLFHQVPHELKPQSKLRQMIDLFLHPPVEKFGTLEFNKGKEIQFLGMRYAEPAIDRWIASLKSERGNDFLKYFGHTSRP